MMSEENKLWDWSSFNTSIAVTMLMSVIVSLILYIRYTVLAEIKYNEAAKYFKDIENLYDVINNNQQVDKRIREAVELSLTDSKSDLGEDPTSWKNSKWYKLILIRANNVKTLDAIVESIKKRAIGVAEILIKYANSNSNTKNQVIMPHEGTDKINKAIALYCGNNVTLPNGNIEDDDIKFFTGLV